MWRWSGSGFIDISLTKPSKSQVRFSFDSGNSDFCCYGSEKAPEHHDYLTQAVRLMIVALLSRKSSLWLTQAGALPSNAAATCQVWLAVSHVRTEKPEPSANFGSLFLRTWRLHVSLESLSSEAGVGDSLRLGHNQVVYVVSWYCVPLAFCVGFVGPHENVQVQNPYSSKLVQEKRISLHTYWFTKRRKYTYIYI